MRIAITGASGFVGQPLQAALRRAGHTVLSIGRRRPHGAAPDVAWDPLTGTIDAASLQGVDAIIHLASENIGQRWTTRVRRAIRASRLRGTALIARTAAALDPRPRVLVSMSGTGIYGDRGDETLTEESRPGGGFLAEVAAETEHAASAAREAGIRVVHPRMGPVLHRDGGALARLVPIFSLGVGGRIGSGRQWMSWIARADAAAALQFLVETTSLSGPVNVVAPNPVRNAEFTATLARVLRRPAIVVVPEFAVRLMYGQMGMESIVWGQRVDPGRLLAAGFRFGFPELEPALIEAVRRT